MGRSEVCQGKSLQHLDDNTMKELFKNFKIEKYGATSIQIHWLGTYHHEMVFKGHVSTDSDNDNVWTVFVSWAASQSPVDSFFVMDFIRGNDPKYEEMTGRTVG